MGRGLNRYLNISDLRRQAKRTLPRGLFEFIDRGVEDEIALNANESVFDGISLQPRVLRDVSSRDLSIELFGRKQALPLALSPTGAAGLLWYDGEVALARAAKEVGVPFALSTASITSIERIAEEAGGRLWFQLYIVPDWNHTKNLVGRVKAAGFEALVVTVDSITDSNREYNERNGFTLPLKMNYQNSMDCLLHAQWSISVLLRYVLSTGLPRLHNLPVDTAPSLKQAKGVKFPKAQSLTWDVVKRLRHYWDGPIIVKGILDPQDAAMARSVGADGIVLSNHGGRSVDTAVSPMQVLERVLESVGAEMPVLIDSGFRRGTHIAKALALGARAVMVGRAPLYGVAVGGKEGAHHALCLLKDELDRTLVQLGCRTISDLIPGLIHRSDTRAYRNFSGQEF